MSNRTDSVLPLELDAVSYAVGGEVLLREISARFEGATRSVILGPNGAGKSLTLRVAHGLLQPTSGRLVCAGAPAREGETRGAMVFEKPVLLRRSAVANVEYALGLQEVPRAERRERALEALEWTGLSKLASRPARVLSAGEQQRLSLARAWAVRPEVLFLDEPTAALDPGATRSIESLILQVAEQGSKVVMTTHDLGQARRLAGEVLFMNRGEVLEQSPAERFFEAPQSELADSFLKGELIG